MYCHNKFAFTQADNCTNNKLYCDLYFNLKCLWTLSKLGSENHTNSETICEEFDDPNSTVHTDYYEYLKSFRHFLSTIFKFKQGFVLLIYSHFLLDWTIGVVKFLKVKGTPGEARRRKKSYDTFSVFEILVFLEMGHYDAAFDTGLTPFGAIKLTQEGSKHC